MAISSSLAKAYKATQSAPFRQRVAMALLDGVSVVASEDVGTANHANRASFAAQVALNPDRWAAIMVFGLIEVNSNIQTAITAAAQNVDPSIDVADSDINAAVPVVWNFYSNAAAALVNVDTKVL